MSVFLDPESQHEIKENIISALNKAFGNNNTEPKMILNLAKSLEKIFNSYRSENIHFDIRSIFIHQKPYVINRDPNSFWYEKHIELGDLMLINNLDITSERGEFTHKRLALLLQAKKTSIKGGDYIIPREYIIPRDDIITKDTKNVKNKRQLDLYANWPKFKYKSSELNSKLNIKEHRFIDTKAEKNIWDGAKFLLINEKRDDYGMSDYVAVTTSSLNESNSIEFNLSKFNPFYCELFNFITGNAGKEFDLTKNDNGWNSVINDLINEIAYCKLPTSFSSNNSEETRGIGFPNIYMSGIFSNESLFKKLYDLYKEDKENNTKKFDDFENNTEMEGLQIIEINTTINYNKDIVVI